MYPASYGSANQGSAHRSAREAYEAHCATYKAPDTMSKLDPRVPEVSQTAPGKESWFLSPNHVMLIGLGVLTLMVTLPISDAFILLYDPTYQFWSGSAMPIIMIIVLILTLIAFFMSAQVAKQQNALQTFITLSTTFLTTIGIILIFGSMYLYFEDTVVEQALTYSCGSSPITADAKRYYSSLLALRKTASCSSMDSVAQCSGYQDAAPSAYSSYFEHIEENFRCSGFCYAAASTASNATLIELGSEQRREPRKVRAASSAFLVKQTTLKTSNSGKSQSFQRAAVLPPALFSKTTYHTSCDGAVARQIGFTADRIAGTWWNTAIVFIAFSAALALLECCGSWKSRRRA